MDAFDFFMPEQAEASHLRRIADSMQAQNRNAILTRRNRSQNSDMKKELEELREQISFLNGLSMVLIRTLTENNMLSLADLSDLLEEVDALDGTVGDGLDHNVLRGMLGFVKQAENDNEQEVKDTEPRKPMRLRRHRSRR